MIDPLMLINNDMATMIMSSQRVFEEWRDNTAMHMKTDCVEQLQDVHKSFNDQMNTWMRIYMHAEQVIKEQMDRINNL